MKKYFYKPPKEEIVTEPKRTLRKFTRTKIGKWSRKGMPRKTKEMWHIPKRASFEQIKEIVKILINLDLNDKIYKGNVVKINRELARRGFTQSGTMLTPSAFGTLIALVKYFGYIFIKDGKIVITNAGIELLKGPINQFKNQILKLQITNPLILEDCENVFVFPFKEIIKLLLKLGYLTNNEIGYVVFMNFKREEDFEEIVKKILKFRKLNQIKKNKIIEKFNKTPEGNVTLAKAPSVGYFISFLLHADLCDKTNINGEPGIKLKNTGEAKMLLDKYADAQPFNFGDNLDLWIKYIGSPNRLNPPREKLIKFKDPTQKDKLILISQNGEQIDANVINAVSEINVSLFDNEKYLINVFELKDGSNIGTFEITSTKDQKEILVDLKDVKPMKAPTLDDWAKLIREHADSPDFDTVYKSYLNTLSKVLDIKSKNGRLRGGRLEFLFYKFLEQLGEQGLIINLKWNGKLGKYGINQPAPGGRLGFPDITFSINGFHFVLELTTIKNKSSQWSAEGSSVPDHIRIFLKQTKKGQVIGIFCAPIQFERNINALKSNLKDENIPILCYEVNSLIDVFLSKNPLKKLLEDTK